MSNLIEKIKIFAHDITIGRNAFHHCHSLDQITIHSTLNDQFKEFKRYAKIVNF